MIKKLFKSQALKTERNKQFLELEELKEICEILIRKVEKNVDILKSAEERIDKKIERLEKLVSMADKLELNDKPSSSVEHKQQILDLYKKGVSISEISRVTGVPIGEVELMIKLNQL